MKLSGEEIGALKLRAVELGALKLRAVEGGALKLVGYETDRDRLVKSKIAPIRSPARAKKKIMPRRYVIVDRDRRRMLKPDRTAWWKTGTAATCPRTTPTEKKSEEN